MSYRYFLGPLKKEKKKEKRKEKRKKERPKTLKHIKNASKRRA